MLYSLQKLSFLLSLKPSIFKACTEPRELSCFQCDNGPPSAEEGRSRDTLYPIAPQTVTKSLAFSLPPSGLSGHNQVYGNLPPPF